MPARVSRDYMVFARVAWLHGLCLHACHVITWFLRVSRGYMVCARARVTWLHGLRPCACRVVTWFAYSSSPSPSPTACGRICELQRCSVSSNNNKYGYNDINDNINIMIINNKVIMISMIILIE